MRRRTGLRSSHKHYWLSQFLVISLALGEPARAQAVVEVPGSYDVRYPMDAKRMSLGARGFDHGTFEHVARLKSLEEVAIDGPAQGFVLNAEDIQFLEGVSKLKKLRIVSIAKEDTVLAAIARLQGLEELTIEDDGKSLEKLHSLQGLRELNVYGLAAENLHKVSAFQRLKVLGLTSGLSDAHISSIGSLRELEELSASDTCNLTDAGIAKLSDLPRLRRAQINDCRITGSGFSGVSWPALQRLTLSGNPVTDDLAAGLQSLPSLKTLLILKSAPRLTDKFLCTLALSGQIQEILGGLGPGVTDRGIECLKGHPALKEIWLENTSVTPASAERLLAISSLREVTVPSTWPDPVATKLIRELSARRMRDLKEGKK